MALDYFRTTQLQLGEAVSGRSITAFSPPGIAIEAAKYPVLMAGVLASTEATEYLSIFDHPEAWMGLDREAVLSMRRRLYRFNIAVDARKLEPSDIVQSLQTIALSVSPVAIEIEASSLPQKKLLPLGGQLPASSEVEISSLVIKSKPEISRVAKQITSFDIPASEAAWKLLDYDYTLDQVVRMMSVGLLGRLDNRRFVPTRGAYKAVIDAYISRVLMELSDKPVSGSFRVARSDFYGENFAIFSQPGDSRVDYFKIERTPYGFERDVSIEGVKNVTIDSKTSIFADSARFSAYQDLAKQGESAHISIFHYTRNNANNILGPWIVRAGVKAAFNSDQFFFDTQETAVGVLDSILSPHINIWTKKESLLNEFGGTFKTVEH
jgi:hypothetical protein